VVSILLALCCLSIYLPAIFCDFLNYDDDHYVTANPHVNSGLLWQNVTWGFTHAYAANWHPLTWLSHMLDVRLYGLHPAGHHLTNLLFHSVNTVLLFLLLRSLTGAVWRSAFVAALFGLHPLHVESVAWIAERKDVLSGFFLILTLWAYARYARLQATGLQNELHASRFTSPVSRYSRPASLWYAIALLCFVLGLMSKPMLVTVPFVLLLLDIWPLERLQLTTQRSQLKTLLPLLYEKVPFLAISAAACAVTVWAQKRGGALVPMTVMPLEWRVCNALVAYVAYIGKLLWPANLAVIYAHAASPELGWPIEQVGLGALMLVSITLATLCFRGRPYLLVGWGWYLGMLVPVIGLVQVGNQTMADRYTYLPAVGLFLAVTWGIESMVGSGKSRAEVAHTYGNSPARKPASASVLALICFPLFAALAFGTGRQLFHWMNSQTLFRHALAVTKDNYVAWNSLGLSLARVDLPKNAEQCYRSALSINTNYKTAYNSLGCLLNDQKRYEEAVAAFQQALQIDPEMANAENNLGLAFLNLGRTNDAIAHFKVALQLQPSLGTAHLNLAKALAEPSEFQTAREHYLAAIDADPHNSALYSLYADRLAKEGSTQQAAEQYQLALKANPKFVPALLGLGDALLEQGRPEEAIPYYSHALTSTPAAADVHYRLAQALVRRGDFKQAVQHYHQGMRSFGDSPEALNNLAWLLATNLDPQVRDGREAVQLGERACKLTEYKKAIMVGTLAAAYAEAGRFADAVTAAEKAKSLAEQANEPAVAAKNASLLELYRAGKPFHEPP
jgi:tetratricopeptide (TPR) repeat protein